MSPQSKSETQPVAFRLPKTMVEALDRYAAELTRRDPHFQYNRSDAAKALLMAALERVEGKRPTRQRG